MPPTPKTIRIPQVNKAYLLIGLNLKLVSATELFENTALSLESLNATDTVDVPVASQMVRNLNKYSPSPNWPAILGAHLGIASHGPVGYAAISAPTVGKALTTFVEWFQIRCETYSGKIIQHDENFDIIISDTTGDQVFQEIFFESFMRAFEVLIELLIGHAPTGETELHFRSNATNRLQLMQEEYASKLAFGADTNKLVVPKRVWFHPSPLYDKDSFEFNLRKCAQLLEEQDLHNRTDLQVRHIIRVHFEQIIVSTDAPFPPPTQYEICNSIHVIERTLIRRLKEYNTSYKLILKEERQRFAERLLKEARYTIYNIAEILGYQESANFCRAFKRWTGQSPTEFRRLSD
mgnify:FL=1